MTRMKLFRLLASALLSASFAAAVPTVVLAQTPQPAKSDKKAAKSEAAPEAKADDKAKAPRKLTAQQQKMKDCGAKWQEEKKAKGVSGKAAYQTFLKGCLKG